MTDVQYYCDVDSLKVFQVYVIHEVRKGAVRVHDADMPDVSNYVVDVDRVKPTMKEAIQAARGALLAEDGVLAACQKKIQRHRDEISQLLLGTEGH